MQTGKDGAEGSADRLTRTASQSAPASGYNWRRVSPRRAEGRKGKKRNRNVACWEAINSRAGEPQGKSVHCTKREKGTGGGGGFIAC